MKKMTNFPSIWGLQSLIEYVQNGDPIRGDGKGGWNPARPMGMPNIKQRFKAAWLVFTGRADAVVWEGGQ